MKPLFDVKETRMNKSADETESAAVKAPMDRREIQVAIPLSAYRRFSATCAALGLVRKVQMAELMEEFSLRKARRVQRLIVKNLPKEKAPKQIAHPTHQTGEPNETNV